MSNADFVTSLLEKMGRNDKDFRYMACSDLLSNLEKDNFKLDAGQEKKISAQLLKLIVTDTNGEVQTLAQNCLGPFIKKCSESQIKETITSLLNTLASENISYRDNSSFGLKTIVNNIPVKFGNIILALLVPKLIETLQSSKTPIDVKAEALDILPAALQRFGSSFEDPAVYSPLQTVVLDQLLSSRKNNRKRAGVCIAHLALYLLPRDFRALISFLVSNTEAAKNHDVIKSCIQTLGNLSKSAGFRLADCIDDVVPIVIACVKGEHQNIRSSALEADDELRENCFQTLESLVLRCPNTVGKHIDNIIALCLEYVSYDPNFFAGSDDENNEDNMDTEDNEEFAAFEEEEEDYDNEDVSWKVRKAASKTISAIISTRQELLETIAAEVAPVLVNRFKEREETVKIDIFKTFENYLKQVHYASSLLETQPAENLRKLVGTIIAALTKILNEKTLKIKIRIGVFSLLKELVQVTNNALTGFLDPLVPGIVSSLSDKSGTSNLKIEVLTFLRLLYATHKPDTFLSHISQFIEQVFICVGDNYYKINAEALRLCTTLVEVIATAPRGNFREIISGLYNATLPKLRAQDIDQEVKETAINTASSLITHLGDSLSAKEMDECLKILESRLSNEITRLTCVKNLSFIANSPLHINLSSILQSSVSQITSFLRLNNRQLKQSALVTLDSFYKTQGDSIHGLIPDLLEQTAPLIGDDDLQLSHLALQLTNTVLLKSGDALIVKNKIFPRILKLIESKVLQGLALESLLNLLETCITVNANDFGFQTIFSAIDAMTDKPTVLKQSYPSIAQVVASICAKTTEANRSSAVSKYIAELKVKENLKKSVLSLLCIGEIGRRVDLSNISGLESIIVDTFNDNTEDIKSAASFCLGNLAVGNLKYYLPFILKDIPLHNEHQYLLLQSLREVITKLSASEKGISELQEFLNTVLVLLYENCKAEKEVVRNVVAECLGRLTLVEPNILITGLRGKLLDPSPFDRWTAVTALKFAIVDNRDINDKLRPHIIEFLKLLSDEDLNVKKAALLTFNFIAHNKPILILDLLPTLLPPLYSESEVKQELLRKVKVGPFHHLVDDGLENRKAAYECMSTLMEKCLNRLDLMVFIQYLSKGLEDHSPDIKSMCHIILERLASSPVAGASIVQSLESFVGPLHATLNAKPKETAVKQDKDRYEELVRSTLRAIYAIYKLPGVETCVKFSNFMSQVVLVGEIGEKFKSLQENSETTE